MNINIKNCDVNIITGTETLEISGKTEITPAEETPATNTESTPAEETGVISQMTYTPKSILKNFDNVRIGDRVKLPAFTVPAVKMDGDEVMELDEIKVADEYATVYKIDGEQISLVFDRALFRSAIDRNDTGVWEDTQLAAYLRGAFLDALRKETSAADCGLLRKEELWGDNALPFFRNGINRVCFDKDEDCSVWYWTETVENASAAYFCIAKNGGSSSYDYASIAVACVRPRFIILKS